MSTERYESKEEIALDVDRTMRRIDRYWDKVISFRETLECVKKNPDLKHQIPEIRRRIDYCAVMANRLEQSTLATLKEKLAEFQTGQFAGMDSDTSIPKPKSLRPRKKKIIPAATVPSGQEMLDSNCRNEQTPTVPDSQVSERETLTVGPNISAAGV